MRLKALLSLSLLWSLCISDSEARDLLSCDYKPTDRIPKGRFGGKRKSPTTIYRLYKGADNYDTIHPVFKKWIEQNQKDYRYLVSGESLLYVNDEDGIGLYEKGGHIYLYRTRLFGDDQAWSYTKEPAINPETGRPWIELTDSEWREVKRGNAGLNEPDEQFFNDVLAILNENFHYFYGMKLVDLGRDPKVDKAQLIGKFVPTKATLFGKYVDALDLSAYSKQQATLYRTLGHPIYSYEGLITQQSLLGIGSDCGGKGIITGNVANGRPWNFTFHNQPSPDDINPSLAARAGQLLCAPAALRDMMEGLKKICEERGVYLRTRSTNKTPLQRALYFAYNKTNKYVEEMVTHPYVADSFNTGAIEKGVNYVYDVVPVEGLIGEHSSSRKAGKDSSSKSKRAKSNRNKTKKYSRKLK